MSDISYKTISETSEGIYKEKGSKFLSFAYPVTSVEEIKIILEGVRKSYFDARHVCYAYVLGNNQETYRSNDDGEPSGTAGKPILGQVYAQGLTNILVVVVRYFGGILLGTGGLVVAYREASADALNRALVIEKIVKTKFTLRFDYLQLNGVMSLCKSYNADILSQNFDNECVIVIELSKASEIFALKKLDQLSIHSTIHVHVG